MYDHTQVSALLDQINELYQSADSIGCSDDLTVVSQKLLWDVCQKAQQLRSQKTESSSVPAAYWDSKAYGEGQEGSDAGKPFKIDVVDQRETHGQLYVDVAGEEGELDDIASVTFEINRLPGSAEDVPCIHLHFDGDNLAASFFKQGDRYVIRPETNVGMRDTVLPNGERGWILE